MSRCFWVSLGPAPVSTRTTWSASRMSRQLISIVMRLRSSGAFSLSQNTFGTTPNIAPPSILNSPSLKMSTWKRPNRMVGVWAQHGAEDVPRGRWGSAADVLADLWHQDPPRGRRRGARALRRAQPRAVPAGRGGWPPRRLGARRLGRPSRLALSRGGTQGRAPARHRPAARRRDRGAPARHRLPEAEPHRVGRQHLGDAVLGGARLPAREDRGIRQGAVTRRRVRRVAATLVVIAGILTVLSRVARSSEQPGFTLGKAIVIAGYVALPALILLAAGLLVVALLLVGGQLVERRKRRS